MSGYQGVPSHEQRLRAERDAAVEKLDECEGIMRALASSLSAGGYNAPNFDPKVFGEKIRWGIDEHAQMQVTLAHDRLIAERDAAVKRAEEAESKLLRQAWADSYERPDQLREQRAQAVAERDAAVAEAAEWKRQRDDMADKLDAALRDALATAQELRQGIEEKEAAVKTYVGPAIDALHAAGILTFGTLAQGVEKLAGERDAAKKETADYVDGIHAVLIAAGASEDLDELEKQINAAGPKPSYFVRQQFEKMRSDAAETEEALERLSSWASHDPQYPGQKADVRSWLKRCGLWRDPAPARADESGEGR